jgi:hypothetical protein
MDLRDQVTRIMQSRSRLENKTAWNLVQPQTGSSIQRYDLPRRILQVGALETHLESYLEVNLRIRQITFEDRSNLRLFDLQTIASLLCCFLVCYENG